MTATRGPGVPSLAENRRFFENDLPTRRRKNVDPGPIFSLPFDNWSAGVGAAIHCVRGATTKIRKTSRADADKNR